MNIPNIRLVESQYCAPEYDGCEIIAAGWVSIDDIHRGPNWARAGDYDEEKVNEFREMIETGYYMPYAHEAPVTEYVHGKFVLSMGNHRHQGHLRANQEEMFICVVNWRDEESKQVAMSCENGNISPRYTKNYRTVADIVQSASKILNIRMVNGTISKINEEAIDDVLKTLKVTQKEGLVEAHSSLMADHHVRQGVKKYSQDCIEDYVSSNPDLFGDSLVTPQLFRDKASKAGYRALINMSLSCLDLIESGQDLPEVLTVAGAFTNVTEKNLTSARAAAREDLVRQHRVLQRLGTFLTSDQFVVPDLHEVPQLHGVELDDTVVA